jgi:tetratricopeptide (TPR) repeat protein
MTTVDNMMSRAGEAFRSNDLATAEALYSAAIDMQPSNAKAYSNRSAVHMRLGAFPSALKDAEACTRIDPGFAKGWGRHGAALQAMKHYEAAVTAYQRAFQLEPSNGSYAESLAELRELVGKGKGVATDEGREEYYFRRSVDSGVSAMKEGRYDEACRLFSKAMSQTSASKGEMHVLLANRSAAHLKANRSLDALDDAREATEVCPSYARGHTRLAAAAVERGAVETASRAIAEALRLDPKSSAALEVNAIVVERKRRTDENAKAADASAKATRDDVAKAMASTTKLDDAAPVSHHRETQPQGPTVSGTRHTVSYSYCRICSEYGHGARDCPLRKR